MSKAKKKTTVKSTFQQKFENFLKALVETYGQGAHITYGQAAAVYDGGDFAKWRNFAKNRSYRVGHGTYVATTAVRPLRNTKGRLAKKV